MAPQQRVGTDLEIRLVGRGNHLVLLHSLLSDAGAFQHILPGLAAGHRLTLPSLPGYGHSPASEADVEQVARELTGALTEIGAERFDLLGNGYGGFIALSIAQQFGERVDRLVLLDSAACFPPAGKQGIRVMKENVEKGGMKAVADIALKRLFPESFMAANPELVERYRSGLLGFEPRSFARTCQNLIDVDLRPGLAAVRNETLVVVGLEDAATPPALAREVASAIPGAKLVEIPGCGHAPHVQAPEQVLRILKDFLDR